MVRSCAVCSPLCPRQRCLALRAAVTSTGVVSTTASHEALRGLRLYHASVPKAISQLEIAWKRFRLRASGAGEVDVHGPGGAGL
ncbi:hypothetical protein NDU88_008432 [Pleurodeles waltl]|uniref:Uncharacterized protein n=1 Tax=Pleurodeles waltl TaxID=8319 RepID=A0AAV7N8U7_PLEWA|nr:hypothetical protein NDU88_008432 [Pleurodeles waltl]